MQIFEDKVSLRAWRAGLRANGLTLAFVPTMGALHEGHLSLVSRAREEADRVIASIYVNPTQFDRADDLASYPRDPDGDRAMLLAAGCDALFEPTTLYGTRHETWVEVPGLAQHLCGATRPGHFRGVATVVTKLFNLVAPDVAVFGNKDFQQVSLIRKMVLDLDMPIQIVAAETMREADGLAMSSRNRKLDAGARAAATAISRGLRKARAMFAEGTVVAATLEAMVRAEIEDAGGHIDYVAAVNPEELVPLPATATVRADSVIAVAAFFGVVRLIDNMPVGGDD